MPNEPRLGRYRAGLCGTGRAPERSRRRARGDRPGFAGYRRIIGGDEVFDSVRADPKSSFDDRVLPADPLIDMLVGDWDRHRANGAGAGASRGRNPVAADSRRPGLGLCANGRSGRENVSLAAPQLRRILDEFPPVKRLAESGRPIDHRVLNRLDREAFLGRPAPPVGADGLGHRARRRSRCRRPTWRLSTTAWPRAQGPPRPAGGVRGGILPAARAEPRSTAPTGRDIVEFERIERRSGPDPGSHRGTEGVVRFERIIDGRDTREVILFIDPAGIRSGAPTVCRSRSWWRLPSALAPGVRPTPRPPPCTAAPLR